MNQVFYRSFVVFLEVIQHPQLIVSSLWVRKVGKHVHACPPLRAGILRAPNPLWGSGRGGKSQIPVGVGRQPWTPEDPRGVDQKLYLCTGGGPKAYA